MSRMSDAYNDVIDLVVEAIEGGAFYLGDVVEYVNARSAVKAERSVIAGIIDSLDTDYAGGASQVMYMNELSYKDNR